MIESTRICAINSRIKMMVYTKNGHQNYCVRSFLNENKKPDRFIIDGMLKRFKNHALAPYVNVIHFYDNITNQLIEKINFSNFAKIEN